MNMNKSRPARIPMLIGSIMLAAITFLASSALADVTRTEREFNLGPIFVECLGENIFAHWFEDRLVVVKETKNRLLFNRTRVQSGEIVSDSGLEWPFLATNHRILFIPLDGSDDVKKNTVLDRTMAFAKGHSVGNLRIEITITEQYNALGELVNSVSEPLDVTCLP